MAKTVDKEVELVVDLTEKYCAEHEDADEELVHNVIHSVIEVKSLIPVLNVCSFAFMLSVLQFLSRELDKFDDFMFVVDAVDTFVSNLMQ